MVTAVKKNRDLLIDALKGLSALGVLAIHTAFWYGESYTPAWFRSLTLLIDVPLFFFLSGWVSSLGQMGNLLRTLKSLWNNIFCKGIFLVCILFLIGKAAGIELLPESTALLASLSLDFSFEHLPLLNGSMWFISCYLKAVVLNQVLICLLEPSVSKHGYSLDQLLISLFWLELALFFFSCANVNYLPFQLSQEELFYSMIWMLGAVVGRKKIIIRKGWVFFAASCLCAVLFVASARFLNRPITLVQHMKFPLKPHAMLPWLFYSMPSLLLAIYLRSKPILQSCAPIRLLAKIGKNAIYYFFAQGISVTLVHRILPWKLSPWGLRFAFEFCLNVLLAIVIAEILRASEKVWKQFSNFIFSAVKQNSLYQKAAACFILQEEKQ